MSVMCDWCGEEVFVSPRKEVLAKKHFCNRDHYMKYRKKYNYYPHSQEKQAYYKIKRLAEKMRQEKNVVMH